MKRVVFGLVAFMCGITAIAGVLAFFRMFSTDFSEAVSNLVLALICLLLTILLIQKCLKPSQRVHPVSRKRTPPKNFAERELQTAMESSASQMLSSLVTVETHSVDSDEDVATPKGAEISYLDARALDFWDGKRTDFIIPPSYSESAFGRNVGPALGRLLRGKYLECSGMERNIALKTVPELKAILAEHELKISGKKGELIARLMNNLSEYELRELFPVGVYCITEKGREAMKPYSIISVNDRHALGFSYYRLLKEREKTPNASDEDILIRLLSQEIQTCYQTRDQYQYQTVITKVARFMQEIGEIQRALDCYVLSFFVFAMQIKSHPELNYRGQSYYISLQLEQCGKLEGYSLEQLVDKMRKTIEENNPFNLANRDNVRFAISLFKKSLSV